MTPRERTDELKRRAAAEGFDAIGVAAAAVPTRDVGALERWLHQGREAGMSWMGRNVERRSDPRRLLEGCRHVIALAMFYGADAAGAAAGAGRVARYARSRDYHKVLGRRLKRLAAWLEETSGVAARSFVDTGPVLERAWAERSGLGWIGKNANLITRGRGSWLLLGEILSAAELVVDDGPHADFCGSCTACLDACPTDAIVEPGVVDSALCISYWTIEHRGPVPAERRAGMHDWIFGCDICQEVCPWNERFARDRGDDPFERRADLDGLDPCEILGLDEAAFRARYSGTPLMRAKWEGMRRNACIVLGNLGRREATPALAAALGDVDPDVRGHAAWALARLGGQEATAALRAALTDERDPEVIREIAAGLA